MRIIHEITAPYSFASNGVVVRNTKLLELIHSDLCEFEGILTHGGSRYIINFIDDFSKYTTVYLLKNKSDAFEKFQDFLKKLKINLVEK